MLTQDTVVFDGNTIKLSEVIEKSKILCYK